MMALWAMCATAQPRVTDNGFIKMPNPHPVLTKTLESKALSSTTPNRANKAKADAVTYIVELILNFDPETEEVAQIRLINDEYNLVTPEEVEFNNGSNYLEIPEGTFDIIVTFVTLNPPTIYDELPQQTKHVIREQVLVNQDLLLTVASSDAKNHIHFQTLTPSGEPVKTNKYGVDEGYNFVLLEENNCDDLYFHNWIYCNDYGLIMLRPGNYSYSIESLPDESFIQLCHEDNADFYINDVSDRYTFYAYRIGYKGCDVFTSAYEIQGATSDVTITNDPSKYELFEEPFVSKSPQDQELYQHFSVGATRKDALGVPFQAFTMQVPIPDDTPCRYYIGASVNDSKIGLIPILEPGVSIKTPGSFRPRSYRVAPRLFKIDDQIILANNGIGSTLNYDWMWGFINFETGFDDNHEPTFFPNKTSFNPNFSYPIDSKTGNLGNNCPIVVSNAGYSEVLWFDGRLHYSLSWNNDFMGRYGEKNYQSHYDLLSRVELNGEEIFSGKGVAHLDLPNPINGQVDVYLDNEIVTVDDMSGSNNSHLHFTAGDEDSAPPTMTMLHFKDINGIITDRFVTSLDGTLEFSAGDFNPSLFINAETYYDRHAPESVEVSYSPYGEDNWNELAVEEVPENYWPVMGWFYTGSLAGVTGQGLNGWFDLKIRLTDAAGNWQEQVLSPAFRIDDHAYSSVASVGSSNAHEVARYNLAGQRVDANTTGVVIIKMSDGTARKVIL